MSHIKINNSRESLEEYLGLGLIEFAVNGSEGVIMEALGFGDGNDEERCDQLYNTVTSWAQCFKESWDEFHEENDDPSMEEEHPNLPAERTDSNVRVGRRTALF